MRSAQCCTSVPAPLFSKEMIEERVVVSITSTHTWPFTHATPLAPPHQRLVHQSDGSSNAKILKSHRVDAVKGEGAGRNNVPPVPHASRTRASSTAFTSKFLRQLDVDESLFPHLQHQNRDISTRGGHRLHALTCKLCVMPYVVFPIPRNSDQKKTPTNDTFRRHPRWRHLSGESRHHRCELPTVSFFTSRLSRIVRPWHGRVSARDCTPIYFQDAGGKKDCKRA